MNVLSLFDGISCGQVALRRAGLNVKNYYASEVDKYAIQITQHNYPNTIQLGDVTKWQEWDLDWSNIDLVMGGSPCQGFSFAGKQLAFDDLRSALFFVFVDILNHVKKHNPNVRFLLENVKMKKEFLDVISAQLGVWPKNINSKLLSAQMRNRYYWFNWSAQQPTDKGERLRDIIDSGYVGKDKSWCILESWNRFPKKTESAKGRYKRSMMPIVFSSESLCFEDGWRELNINEVERLQTLPDGYCDSVDEKIGKGLIGNGWTVDVIAHIFKGLKC